MFVIKIQFATFCCTLCGALGFRLSFIRDECLLSVDHSDDDSDNNKERKRRADSPTYGRPGGSNPRLLRVMK
jgi:hypothetical protein